MGRKLDGNSVKVDLMPSFPAVFKPSNVPPEDEEEEEESDEEHAQDEDEQDVDEQDGDEQEGDVDEDDVEVGGIVNPVNVEEDEKAAAERRKRRRRRKRRKRKRRRIEINTRGYLIEIGVIFILCGPGGMLCALMAGYCLAMARWANNSKRGDIASYYISYIRDWIGAGVFLGLITAGCVVLYIVIERERLSL